MTNILGFAKVDNLLRYILGVVRNALQALGDHHQVQTAGNIRRICDHVTAELAMNLAIEFIDLFVLWNELARDR